MHTLTYTYEPYIHEQMLPEFVDRKFRVGVSQRAIHHRPIKAPVAGMYVTLYAGGKCFPRIYLWDDDEQSYLPTSGAYRVRPMKATIFRAYYDR